MQTTVHVAWRDSLKEESDDGGTGSDPQGVKGAGVAEEKNLCRSLTRLRDDDRMKLNGMWAESVKHWRWNAKETILCGSVEWYAWIGEDGGGIEEWSWME